MLFETAKVSEIAPGGLVAVEVNGEAIVLGNYGGRIYAVGRRCGHMNAPLELGTLEGYIITCPLHHVQFDITTGEALSPPVPRDFGAGAAAEALADYWQKQRDITRHIEVCDIRTFSVRIDGDRIKVEL